MMRLVTLLAVVDIGGEPPISRDVGGETSSTGDTRPAAKAVALFLPKLSFHLEGFFVTGGGILVGADGGGGCCPRLLVRGALSSAEGRANMEIGSNGSRARREEVDVLMDTDLWLDEVLDALLISRARDCEASANVASVSSLESVVTMPLPLRAPLFLRLLVEVDLDVVPSRSRS